MVSMRHHAPLLIAVLLVLFIPPTVQAQQDPYLIYGTVYTGDEPAVGAQVVVTLDRTQKEYTTDTNEKGFFVMILTDYNEGDTYTIRAKSEGMEGVETGRIVIYDREGYQREGDRVDIHFEGREDDTWVRYLLIVLLLIPIILLIDSFRNKRGCDERKEQ